MCAYITVCVCVFLVFLLFYFLFYISFKFCFDSHVKHFQNIPNALHWINRHTFSSFLCLEIYFSWFNGYSNSIISFYLLIFFILWLSMATFSQGNFCWSEWLTEVLILLIHSIRFVRPSYLYTLSCWSGVCTPQLKFNTSTEVICVIVAEVTMVWQRSLPAFKWCTRTQLCAEFSSYLELFLLFLATLVCTYVINKQNAFSFIYIDKQRTMSSKRSKWS